MIRRPVWLAAGAAIGVGGTLWAQRRIERLARRVRPTAVANGVAKGIATAAEKTRRGTTGRVRAAVDAGRADARRREDELWHGLTASGPPR